MTKRDWKPLRDWSKQSTAQQIMEATITSKRASSNLKTIVALLITLFVLGSVVPSTGLRCYRCGQYTDGVGSITPCLNFTPQHLQECPEEMNTSCIKFVSEGSVVRDCIDHCTEKETWGAQTFCCDEDACNSSDHQTLSLAAWLCSFALVTLRKITSI